MADATILLAVIFSIYGLAVVMLSVVMTIWYTCKCRKFTYFFFKLLFVLEDIANQFFKLDWRIEKYFLSIAVPKVLFARY